MPDTDVKRSLSPWHVAAMAIVVAGLLLLVVLVLNGTSSAQDATTVLAVIVPAFASIGAAIFGVQVAYEKGKDTGGKEGEAVGAARGHSAGQRELAASLLRYTEAGGASDGFRSKGGSSAAEADGLTEVRNRLLSVLGADSTAP